MTGSSPQRAAFFYLEAVQNSSNMVQEITGSGGIQSLRLQHSNGVYAEILPAHGAMLHAFGATTNAGETINVIDSYQTATDLSENYEGLGFKGAKLSPFVCRLQNGSYQLHEQDYKVDSFYMDEHAIHGFMYAKPFTRIHQQETNGLIAATFLHEYDGHNKGFPFPYSLQVTYELSADATLTIRTTATNTGSEVIPMSDGWHPYFTLGNSINDLWLQIKASNMLEFDEDLLPTGNVVPATQFAELQPIGDTTLDNSFTADFAQSQPMVVLEQKGVLTLEIYPAESYRFIQVYTPGHRKSIAIENLSSAPNAFNNGIGLIYLLPGENAQFETAYKLHLHHASPNK